jgi:hypothetical protein
MKKEEEKEGFVSNLDAESTKASRRKNPSRLALGRRLPESMIPYTRTFQLCRGLLLVPTPSPALLLRGGTGCSNIIETM